MPRLIIDDREIEVPEGTKVIEAAERLGIMIPRFCYHEGLGSVGACRMCAVKFLQGPFKGVQMSCMIDAQDGMVVSTTDEEAVEFRKYVIELLMLNHPHDCPVCDEGGQCLLQDETVSGGHGIRRFQGKKRTYRDQYLGVLIQHEMNRCIHCYRCSRFYQEFAGYRDLGSLQIANRVYFGRYSDGQLESPFSGNLLDICPTGVYTDKPARFKARRWDLERSPSLCIHCSLGCSTIANARYRELICVEARLNRAVNGFFVCDLGRFGHSYANHPGRMRRARIDAWEGPWDEAVRSSAENLKQIVQHSGSGSVACIGSTRSSMETLSMLKRFCRVSGLSEPACFLDPAVERKVKQAVSKLDQGLALSLREIEGSDFILAVGVDPVNEAPMLALAMRQAWRKGATVAVMDPRPVFLPFVFKHLPVAVRDMDACLDSVMKRVVDAEDKERLGSDILDFYRYIPSDHSFDSKIEDHIPALGAALVKSRRPVLVCGTDIVRETTPPLAGDHAFFLRSMKEGTGLFYIFRGANAFGAAALSLSVERSFTDVLEGIEKGDIKALVVVESDPFYHFPDQRRLELAINKLDFLLVLDYLPSGVAHRANIVLPTLTLFESDSCFINQEGRVQFAEAVHRGGIPVFQEGKGSHPPRIYRTDIPGGDPRPAWRALADLSRSMGLPEDRMDSDNPWKVVSEECPVLQGLQGPGHPVDGFRILPERLQVTPHPPNAGSERERPGTGLLELFLVDWTFGTEELSAYSHTLHQVEKEPWLCMHPKDAAGAGFSEGESVVVHLDRGPVLVRLKLSDRMAEGTLILPRHRKLAWQKLKGFSALVPLDRIKKV